MTDKAATRLLTRQFLRRFIDNDLLSPSGDGHESVTLVFALLIMAGLWVSAALVLKSLSPFDSPFGVLLSALNDKFAGLAGSMIVMGLGTVLEWDALGLDRRDWAVLGPLPIEPRVLVVAKLRALALFVGVFALAMNGVPSVLYPPLQGQKLSIGFLQTVWLVVAHVTACLAACTFGFLVPLAVRQILRAVFGPRMFRAVSAILQFVAVLCLISALLLVATVRLQVPATLDRANAATYLSPPMWFVGLYETMISPVVRPAPAEAPWKRQFWSLQENRRARAAYLSHARTFARLARNAVVALVVPGLLCLAALAIARRRVAPAVISASSFHVALGRAASWWAKRCLVRHPGSQAGFFFTLQTLTRSASHRAYLAGYVAVGLAVVVVTAGALEPATGFHDDGAPPSRLLAVQMALSFFLLTGLRAVLAIPAELGGNWVFRLGWDGDWRRYLGGVRRAVEFGLLLPLLLGLAPFHAFLWGVRTSGVHLLMGWLASLVLTELLLLKFRKLPFTCSHSAKGTFKTRWPWYLLGFIAYTFGFAQVERLALGTWTGVSVLAGSLCLMLAGIALYREWLLGDGGPAIFDDPAEEATQRLGLEVGG
jgi:hypothetical protein